MRLVTDEIEDTPLLLLLEHYRQLRDDRPVPKKSDIDPSRFSMALPWVFIVDVASEGPRFVFRLVGEELQARTTIRRGTALSDLQIGEQAAVIAEDYEAAVAEKTPIYAVHKYVDARNTSRHYNRLLLPLSSDTGEIKWLLGGLVFKPTVAPADPKRPECVA